MKVGCSWGCLEAVCDSQDILAPVTNVPSADNSFLNIFCIEKIEFPSKKN